jgi:hypothetical protein
VQRLEGRVEEGSLSQETVFFMMSQSVRLKLSALGKIGWVADRILFGVINKVSGIWKTNLKRGDVLFADPIILPELTS